MPERLNKTSQNVAKITKNPEMNKNARKIKQNVPKMTKQLPSNCKNYKTKPKIIKNSQKFKKNAQTMTKIPKITKIITNDQNAQKLIEYHKRPTHRKNCQKTRK